MNVLEEFIKPNGITCHSYNPSFVSNVVFHPCYEENHSMAWGKPQYMEMNAEINSNLKYANKTRYGPYLVQTFNEVHH
jgi:hypothetical protein